MAIYRYDRESLPDTETLQQISDIYVTEYPLCHSTESRSKDLSKRNTAAQVVALLENDGKIIFTVTTPSQTTASTQERVLGVLEMRFVELPDGVYAQLCWILVDTLARGTWLSEDLYGAFEREVAWFRGEAIKPVAQLLWVHEENPARGLYRKWGFVDEECPKGEKIFMYKD